MLGADTQQQLQQSQPQWAPQQAQLHFAGLGAAVKQQHGNKRAGYATTGSSRRGLFCDFGSGDCNGRSAASSAGGDSYSFVGRYWRGGGVHSTAAVAVACSTDI